VLGHELNVQYRADYLDDLADVRCRCGGHRNEFSGGKTSPEAGSLKPDFELLPSVVDRTS
jgi:hypothetical protein